MKMPTRIVEQILYIVLKFLTQHLQYGLSAEPKYDTAIYISFSMQPGLFKPVQPWSQSKFIQVHLARFFQNLHVIGNQTKLLAEYKLAKDSYKVFKTGIGPIILYSYSFNVIFLIQMAFTHTSDTGTSYHVRYHAVLHIYLLVEPILLLSSFRTLTETFR